MSELVDQFGNALGAGTTAMAFPFNPASVTPSAFSPSDTNSYITKSVFYSGVNATFFNFYQRFVRRWFYWYDGWDPDFHNSVNGIFSTRIATAITDKIAKKVTGGRIMFKNHGKNSSVNGEPNAALTLMGFWAEESGFCDAVKNGAIYAAAGGTALVKLNIDEDKKLWTDVLRLDQFYPTIGFRGQMVGVKCFLKRYANISNEIVTDKNNKTKLTHNSYYLVENRYFGNYERIDGKIYKNVPLVEYKIFEMQGTLVNGTDYALDSQQSLSINEIPESVRVSILEDYGGSPLSFDRPTRLPFKNHLGCELIKWSGTMPGLPELPFGESILNKILACCQTYDYAFSAFATDLYLGRGSVILPAHMTGEVGTSLSGGVGGGGGSNWYSQLDSFMYKQIPNLSMENQKPTPIQFEIRAQDWETTQNKLFKQIAMHLGVNPSFISSSLNDNAVQTARGVSADEKDTAEYVNDTREILERPFNKLLAIALEYLKSFSQTPNIFEDNVVIRWSSSGLTNTATLADIVNNSKQAGTMSTEKAVRMLNYDDDEVQVQEEYNRILAEQKQTAFGQNDFNVSDYYGNEVGNNEQRKDSPAKTT